MYRRWFLMLIVCLVGLVASSIALSACDDEDAATTSKLPSEVCTSADCIDTPDLVGVDLDQRPPRRAKNSRWCGVTVGAVKLRNEAS
jgi:hypothetical protein